MEIKQIQSLKEEKEILHESIKGLERAGELNYYIKDLLYNRVTEIDAEIYQSQFGRSPDTEIMVEFIDRNGLKVKEENAKETFKRAIEMLGVDKSKLNFPQYFLP